MKNVLFITRHYMHQASGGTLCSSAYMFAFANIFEKISIIYPTLTGIDTEKFLPHNAIPYGCIDKRSKARKAFDMYCGKIHRFGKYVKKHLKAHNYDIIIIDHSILACGIIKFIKQNTSSKIITIHHNVEKNYNKDNLQPLLIRFPYNYFANKAEEYAINLSDLNITLTDQDWLFFSSWKKNISHKPIATCGIFENPNTQTLDLAQQNCKDSPLLVISGSLNFPQTEVAITVFINKYYNLAKQITPNVRLIITGRNPSKRIKQMCHRDNTITLTENPDDILSVISSGNIYESPIQGGSGLKLSIMDGLKLGLPIICHENSARGYEKLVEHEVLTTYNDAISFKQAYKKILNHSLPRNIIHDLYKSEYGFQAGVLRLKTILNEFGIL